MQRPLAKSVSILALVLAVPVLCLAWTYEPRAVSKEFDEKPMMSDSIRNRSGGPFQSGPATAINIPAPTQKAPPVSQPLYPPNVAGVPLKPRKPQRRALRVSSHFCSRPRMTLISALRPWMTVA